VTNNRWSRLEGLFHAAAALPPPERSTFLDRECGDDPEFRRELESLLDQPTSGGLLNSNASPALQLGATPDGRPPRTFIGQRVGPYEIVSVLGVGGMGEVYRAKDSRLGREVALKILPAGFATDPARLGRFEGEARILASLNHPNIAVIHGVEEAAGSPAIVMELVEGQTLEERLSAARHATRSGSQRKGLPLKEALQLAGQIADALDAAHGRGIIHRDIKPANIKVTPNGIVKVLDFGIAKTIFSDADGPTAATFERTQPGVIIGTAAYMSPEQARGESVDKRTDIWAFGCVLYEMMAGRTSFADRTPADSIAAILGLDPDWTALPADTPAGVRRLLRRCLEKDPARRLHDIADARADLIDQPAYVLALPDQTESSLYGRALALFGAGSPFRLWEVLQIRISLLQYPIIVFLSWKATSGLPGSTGLLLFLALVVCILVLITVRVMLLTTGAMERQRLLQQARRAAPWLRTCTVALTLLLWWMAALVVASHAILATVLGVIGAAETVAVVFAEPSIARAAFPENAAEDPLQASANDEASTHPTPRANRAKRRRAGRDIF
jgi:serine/threonine protein kinase